MPIFNHLNGLKVGRLVGFEPRPLHNHPEVSDSTLRSKRLNRHHPADFDVCQSGLPLSEHTGGPRPELKPGDRVTAPSWDGYVATVSEIVSAVPDPNLPSIEDYAFFREGGFWRVSGLERVQPSGVGKFRVVEGSAGNV